MANQTNQGQTCLEKNGITARHEHIVRSDYNIEDQYGVTHSDALSNGDAQGKGHATIKGHTHWTPSCNGVASNKIDYKNFATSPDDQIGGDYDINGFGDNPGRKVQMARSIYNHLAQYGPLSVDTTKNREDGQYFVQETTKMQVAKSNNKAQVVIKAN